MYETKFKKVNECTKIEVKISRKINSIKWLFEKKNFINNQNLVIPITTGDIALRKSWQDTLCSR